MKTYQALSINVIQYCDEDVIRTSAYSNFNKNWLFSGTTTNDNGFEGGEDQ